MYTMNYKKKQGSICTNRDIVTIYVEQRENLFLKKISLLLTVYRQNYRQN